MRKGGDMIKAVLFDLDDTLLNIDLASFVARYLSGQARVLSEISGLPFFRTFGAITSGYLAVNSQKRTDDMTNAELFGSIVFRKTGIPISDPAISDALTCYERCILPTYQNGLVRAYPRPGIQESLESAHALGLTVALATNPLFTLAADEVRMEWAGVKPEDFAAISTMENSRRTKPSARYSEEFCCGLGLAPQECLMVGNDVTRDFPRPDIGLPTAYVGHGWPRRAAFRGDLLQFAESLPGIVAYLDASDAREGTIGNTPMKK